VGCKSVRDEGVVVGSDYAGDVCVGVVLAFGICIDGIQRV
jgi:hypothetical protein